MLGKFAAAPWAPATCRACGGLSSESMAPTLALRGVGVIAVPGAMLASLVYASWVPLAVAIGAVILALVAIQAWVPLQPLTATETKRSRRLLGMSFAALGVIGLLLAGLGGLLQVR